MFVPVKLKELRQQRNYTLQNVEDATKINKGMLSKYENGKSVPSCENLEKLADFYKISMDEIFSRDVIVLAESDRSNVVILSDYFINIINALQSPENEKFTNFIMKDPKRRIKSISDYYFRNHSK